MRKVLFFMLTALTVLAAVSCEKPVENDNNNQPAGPEDPEDPEDPVIPPVGIIAYCSTAEASLVTEESARLHGSADITGNEGQTVSAYFYYSATSGDARALKAGGQKVEAGNIPAEGGDFEADISSLLPSTTYYFVAGFSVGEIEEFGEVLSFTTGEPVPAGPRPKVII